ncbi:ferrous iron transport protein B [Gallibacterium sp. AGMB14963]|uniref:ferrous iron transport protein B n=1 Tax=Gallibacterium faecale TaxID=3019086 RepID=UPI0022F14DEE|nr:ferrous iron transport protein B [Gallibacterium sp. AGMB14963]MDA3977991.1 ferrous iron transport protein B [Gallibacterium sp. AGMB14963]
MSNHLNFALIGPPNCGKTVLFNALTGSNARIANYPGVTVDRREGMLLGHPNITILDLPGTYSLHTTSPDEEVSRNVLLGHLGKIPDAIIAVADATNLRMTLRMALELKSLGLPMIISINLYDVATARGLKIDTKKMTQLLGVPVISTIAVSKQGLENVKTAVETLMQTVTPTQKTTAELEQITDNLDSELLFQQVDHILAESVQNVNSLPRWHQTLDHIFLHPVWGLLTLIIVMLLMFQAVYTWAAPFMDLIEAGFGWLAEWVTTVLPEGIVRDLLVDGVIAGISSVLVFLPQITILFALLLVLEDSGYLPRGAYLLDSFLAKSGLSGRSFIPLLSGFACAVPAIMSARTITDPRERLVTIAIAPLLTCSARLPVYALIIAAVIPDRQVWGIFNLQGLTLFALYTIGVISAGFIAFVLKLFAKHKGKVQQFPLLMELPTYRMPNFKHILVTLWERVSAFLKRAGTIIFALSIVLWVLVSFPSAPEQATGPAIDYSFAGTLGHFLEPIFRPIGFTWEMCIAMVPGIAAREVVVAALGTVYAVGSVSEEAAQQFLIPLINQSWGLPTALSFLAWYVYAPMCMATLAVIKRETKSTTKTLLITLYLSLLAYLFAYIVYHLALGAGL